MNKKNNNHDIDIFHTIKISTKKSMIFNKLKFSIAFITIFLTVINCTRIEDPTPEPVIENPSAVTFVTKDDPECYQGEASTDVNKIKVTIDWNVSANTDSYIFELNGADEYPTTESEITLELEKGSDNSYKVVSKNSESTQTTSSKTQNIHIPNDATVTEVPSSEWSIGN